MSINCVKVGFCVFESISKSESASCGGIFNIKDIKLTILCCTFRLLSVTKYGGCIYGVDSHLFLKNSFFDVCRVTTYGDTYFGNAIFIINNKIRDKSTITTIDEISHIRCGRDKTDGDSSIVLYYLHFSVKNSNSSCNSGSLGSSLLSGLRSLENSLIKFSQDFSSTSYTSIESQSKHYNASFCNFINTDNLQYSIIFTNHEDQLTLYYCIFYNSHIKLCNKLCIFIKCQSDKQFNSISHVNTCYPILYIFIYHFS